MKKNTMTMYTYIHIQTHIHKKMQKIAMEIAGAAGRRAPAAQGRGGSAAAAQGQGRRAVAAQGRGTGGAREQAVLTGGGGDGSGEQLDGVGGGGDNKVEQGRRAATATRRSRGRRGRSG